MRLTADEIDTDYVHRHSLAILNRTAAPLERSWGMSPHETRASVFENGCPPLTNKIYHVRLASDHKP